MIFIFIVTFWNVYRIGFVNGGNIPCTDLEQVNKTKNLKKKRGKFIRNFSFLQRDMINNENVNIRCSLLQKMNKEILVFLISPIQNIQVHHAYKMSANRLCSRRHFGCKIFSKQANIFCKFYLQGCQSGRLLIRKN